MHRWQVIQCGLGPNPDYPEIDCAPSKDRNYPALSITVERAASGDEPGLWAITQVERTALHQPEPATKEEVRRFVNAFLRSRLERSGAEAYLSAEGRSRFGGAFDLDALYVRWAHSDTSASRTRSWMGRCGLSPTSKSGCASFRPPVEPLRRHSL